MTEMTYNFKKFTAFNTRTNERVVSLTKNYALGFSAAFSEYCELDRYSHCLLFYDKHSNSIGIKFIGDLKNEPARFTLMKQTAGRGASVTSSSFFKQNDIDINKYAGKRYTPKKVNLREAGVDETGTIFVIDLDKPLGG